MSIDLSKIEDAKLRDELREQIKTDKQAAVEKRLAKIKLDEETEAKLARLKEFEEKEEQAKKAAVLEKAEAEAADLLAKSKVNVDIFKDMRDYDKFLAIEKDEEKEAFITKLKASKPHLFTQEKKSLLDISNADIKTSGKAEEKIVVY